MNSNNFPGEFVISSEEIIRKFSRIKAFISDWDGVFNNGIKNPGVPSPFSEADAMGTNLLRFSFWQKHNQIPPFAFITGADNPSAIDLAKRERFQAVYSQIVNKSEAVIHFCESCRIEPEEVACFFDDANDLGMARLCGLRFFVRRNASPNFMNFVRKNRLCDYITASEGGNHAIREICENFILLNENYDSTLLSRGEFNETYQAYFAIRQKLQPKFYRKTADTIAEVVL